MSDMLMWVGRENYPTVADFVKEAATVGVSKRLRHLPSSVIPEESVLFLVHPGGSRILCETCGGSGVVRGTLEAFRVERLNGEWLPIVPVEERVFATRDDYRREHVMVRQRKGVRWRWNEMPGQAKCMHCKGFGRFPDGVVFGFCAISRFEIVLDSKMSCKEYKERRKFLEESGATPVTPVVLKGLDCEKRAGQLRRMGAKYVVSDHIRVKDRLEGVVDSLGVNVDMEGPLALLKEPLGFQRHRCLDFTLVERCVLVKELENA